MCPVDIENYTEADLRNLKMEVERALATEAAEAMAGVFSHAGGGFCPTGAMREEERTLTVDIECVAKKEPHTDVTKNANPTRSRRRDAHGKRADRPDEVPVPEDINDDHPDERE